MKITIALDGLNPLYARLKAKSQQDFLDVLKETTTYLRNTARKKTPRGDTGKLQQSLRQVNPTKSRDGEVGYTRSYAPHVEYGHRIVRNGKNIGYVQGQYYLKSAVADTRIEFIRLATGALKK